MHPSGDSGRNDYMTLRPKVRLGQRVHVEVRREPRRKGVRVEEMTIKETGPKVKRSWLMERGGEERTGSCLFAFLVVPLHIIGFEVD